MVKLVRATDETCPSSVARGCAMHTAREPGRGMLFRVSYSHVIAQYSRALGDSDRFRSCRRSDSRRRQAGDGVLGGSRQVNPHAAGARRRVVAAVRLAAVVRKDADVVADPLGEVSHAASDVVACCLVCCRVRAVGSRAAPERCGGIQPENGKIVKSGTSTFKKYSRGNNTPGAHFY